MLSKKESQLGVTMARIAAIGTIIIFAIQAVLLVQIKLGIVHNMVRL